MFRQTSIVILLVLCTLGVHADDSIKVSSADLKALLRRVERLEQAQGVSPQIGIADAMPGTRHVDAVSGATKRVPR